VGFIHSFIIGLIELEEGSCFDTSSITNLAWEDFMNFMRRNEGDLTLRCSPAHPLIRNSSTAQLPAQLILYRCMCPDVFHSSYNPNLPGYFHCWSMLKT
jgi:hypothetical protein